MKTAMENVGEVVGVVNQIRRVLAGRSPEIQGAALADLLAIWVAGHHIAGDQDATRTLRSELLATHWRVVAELVSFNAKIMGTTP